MSRKMIVPRLAASALATAMVAGLATAAQAQSPPEVEIQCQYFTGQSDPLTILNKVTEPFNLLLVAAEQNSDQSKLTKGAALAETDGESGIVFADSDVVNSGSFWAELDARLKATEFQEDLFCADSARVRGVGHLNVDTDEATGVDWLIRSNSKLDGSKSSATLEDCVAEGGDTGLEDEACSVHRVKAALRITAQGARNNESLKYDRFTVNQKDIFEAYEGVGPEKGQDVILLCSCAVYEPPIVPEEPIVEE
jgi:hypothetical protein